MQKRQLFMFTILLTAFNCSLFATTYYIDSKDGLDSNSGLSIMDPWNSLEKVNNSDFLPGDSILFKKNSTWSGGLDISSAGTAGNPIVFSAYGLGAKPLINGNGLIQSTIFIRNSASYIVVDGFAVTNYDGLDIFDGSEALRCGIQIGEWSGSLTQVDILNNEVYFIEGCSNHPSVGPPRGSVLDPDEYNLYQNAGIFCHATYMDSLFISGNYVHDCTCTGIFAFQFETATNLLIRQNSVYNIGSDGIVVLNATAPLVELNASIKAGNNSGSDPREPDELGFNGLAVAGIWSFGCSDPIFQYNYCEATKRITWDGQAWDFDLKTTGNAIYQFNYSRDNEGGFNLGGLPHQIFRYNISYNDGAKQGNAQYFFNSSPTYYNNIFYRTDSLAFLFSEEDEQIFQNNIFYTEATSNTTYQDSLHHMSHNCYSGHTPINPGEYPVLADPQFIDPYSPGKILPGVIFTREELREAAQGFQLNASSSCVDAGSPVDNYTGVDFWGNALLDAMMDIGAHEFTDNPTGLHPIDPGSSILIYPNPVLTDIYIKIDSNILQDAPAPVFTLYNSQGTSVYEFVVNRNDFKINRGMLPDGVYFYILSNGIRFHKTGKLILH